jgi:hypothetical protein
MMGWLDRWRHVTSIKPPPIAADAVCVHCGAPADEQWWPACCALASVKKEWMPVCAACDVALNEQTVRFFYGDTMEKYIDAYRAERLPTPPPRNE